MGAWFFVSEYEVVVQVGRVGFLVVGLCEVVYSLLLMMTGGFVMTMETCDIDCDAFINGGSDMDLTWPVSM